MADDTMFGDPFGDPFDDPFGTQQAVTPPMGSMQTKGTGKLLVVIFIIDCSMTMKGDRIAAVNAALRELKFKLGEIKEDYSLDMKAAVMSFTSSTKWDLELTPVDEMNLEEIRVRPGLTEYGAAFHELNKVLRKDRFLQHTGKIAPPAIMFLTDGEPTDDYQSDLDELLKNGWFTNASRSAVLLGDAIDNQSAREAVRQFVEDPEHEIVAAEDSTVIMQKLKLATMHTVAGMPMAAGGQENGGGAVSAQKTPFGDGDPFGSSGGSGDDDPFGSSGGSGDDDPFGSNSGGSGDNDPFGSSNGSGDDDPFGSNSGSGNNDLFGSSSGSGDNDPFGSSNGSGDNDPFGSSGGSGDNDPFGSSGGSGDDDPFGSSSGSGDDDPFGPTDTDGDDDPFGNDPF